MSGKAEYFTDIKAGEMQTNVRRAIKTDLRIWEGKRVKITIERAKSKRSSAQNAMYWSWIDLLHEETKENKVDLHEMVKGTFLTTIKTNLITGADYPVVRSTTELNKTEFSEFCLKFSIWCLEFLNIKLPLPGENWELQFTEQE